MPLSAPAPGVVRQLPIQAGQPDACSVPLELLVFPLRFINFARFNEGILCAQHCNSRVYFWHFVLDVPEFKAYSGTFFASKTASIPQRSLRL